MQRALETDDRSDWLKAAGGILLALGALTLFMRKEEPWSDFPLLLVIGIPFLVLYALGAIGNPVDRDAPDRATRERAPELGTSDRVRHGPGDRRGVSRWRATLLVTAVLLSVFFFVKLMETVGLDPDGDLVSFLIFGLVAAAAAYAAFVLGVAYLALLAALAGVGAWLSLWSIPLDDPSADTQRWLLVLLAAGYLVLGVFLHERRARQAPEIVTAAGIVAVTAGLLGVLIGAAAATVGLVPGTGDEGGGGGQSFFWDLLLLAVSLALVVYGAWAQARGPAYVGAVGLLAFAIIQGLEVNALLDRESPDGSVLGWPLALLLIGAAVLAAGLFLRTPPGRGTRVPAPAASTTSGTATAPRDEY
jgi:hypothetical protein